MGDRKIERRSLGRKRSRQRGIIALQNTLLGDPGGAVGLLKSQPPRVLVHICKISKNKLKSTTGPRKHTDDTLPAGLCVRCRDCMGHRSVCVCVRVSSSRRVMLLLQLQLLLLVGVKGVSRCQTSQHSEPQKLYLSVFNHARVQHICMFLSPSRLGVLFLFGKCFAVLAQLAVAAYFAATHHRPSVCGIVPPCLCCCCDMASRPLSRPRFAHRPLTLETRQVKLQPDCLPVQTLNSSQCSRLEGSLRPELQLHTSQLPAFLLLLRDLWDLRGWSGCRCSRTWAQRWGWSGGRQKGCLVLWSWCTGRRKVPGQIPQTEPPGQQRPGSAVERMKINHFKKSSQGNQSFKQKHLFWWNWVNDCFTIVFYVKNTDSLLPLSFICCLVSYENVVFVRLCRGFAQHNVSHRI